MRADTLAIYVALAAGIAIRWYQLGSASLWFDEGYTAWVVSLPISRLIAAIRADTSPPLYYLLLHPWTQLVGRSEWSLRAPSALCGTLSLLLFVPISRRLLHDRSSAAMAAVLFSLGYLQVSYAHEARFYTWMTLLALVSLWSTLRAIDRPGWRSTLLVTITWTASVYTSNLMAVYVGGGAVAWLLLPGRATLQQRFRNAASAAAITALLFMPWAPVLLQQSRALRGNFWITRPTGWALARAIAVLSGVNEQGIDPLPATVLVWISVLIASSLFVALLNRRTRRTAGALACLGMGPILLVFLLSQLGQPIFVERALIASSAVLPLIIALPAVLGRPFRYGVLAVALLLAIVDVRSWQQHYHGEYAEDWRAACQYAANSAGTEGHIVFAANEGELLYDYYARKSDYSPSQKLTGAPADFFAIDPPRAMLRVKEFADLDHVRRRLDADEGCPWLLVESHSSWADPKHRVRSMMEQRFGLSDSVTFNQVMVYRFPGSYRYAGDVSNSPHYLLPYPD